MLGLTVKYNKSNAHKYTITIVACGFYVKKKLNLTIIIML